MQFDKTYITRLRIILSRSKSGKYFKHGSTDEAEEFCKESVELIGGYRAE